jgi:hypothetical protein
LAGYEVLHMLKKGQCGGSRVTTFEPSFASSIEFLASWLERMMRSYLHGSQTRSSSSSLQHYRGRFTRAGTHSERTRG